MTLKMVDGGNWQSILESSNCILVLSKSTCQNCKEWEQSLSEAISDGFGEGFEFAKVLLDDTNLVKFKMEHTWINQIDIFPHTAIISQGKRVSFMSGKGIQRLQKLIDKI